MWAQVVDGAYFIQNVESGLFLCGANDWGTRACVADEGVEFNLTTISEGEGAYSIQHPLVTVSKKMLGSDLYTDSTTPTGGWKITAVTGEEGVYTIAYVTTSTVTDPETGKEQTVETANYLAQGTDVLAKGHPAISVTEVTDEAKWYILTKAQAIAKLSEATAENPLPATFLLKNPGFNRNLSTSAWTVDAINKNLSGGTDHNRCAESWRSTFTLTQTVELPNGHYKVRAQAALTDYTNAYDGTDYPVVYANDETVPFFSMEEADRGSNMNTLSNAFAAGTYTTDWIEVTVVDKKLSVGVKGTRTDTWCIWDNFQILYCGPLDLSAYATALSDALDAAKAVDQAAPMQATVLADLQAAIAAYDGVSYDNSDDYEAAVSALMDATNAANNSIKAYANVKAYLDEAEKILAGTNVYTAEAYATYYTEPKAKYDALTLTNAEANAFVKTSTVWHSSNTIDDILLSAWTIGGEQCQDYNKGLYINTWSVEGNTDGSEFLAPFFEYWTGDDNSLGANNLVAKVTGLKPNGAYSFTIRARVRQTNDKTKIAEGITMKVGDGTAVDISSGAQFNGGVFYIGNFSAMGQADSEGTLTATITVAANSNISWLSFYNCMVTEGEDLSAYIADYEFALANVNTALTDDTDYAAMQTELKTVATTYATVDNTDKAALIAAKEALEAALANYNTVVGPLKCNTIAEWTTTGNNGKFQVNTWSGEGNTDGSNMKTPFIENWIGSGTNLTNATMTHTVTGLTPGYYKVTALVRTLNEAGGSTPAGSFIFANDNIERAYGDNATACTNGVYGHPVVYGLVGTDGKLNIGIKVLNANVNWVSFKNFTYEFVGTELTAEIAANQTEEKRVFTYAENDEAYQAAVATLVATATNANYVAAGKAISDAYALAGTEYKVETSVGAEGYATIILPSEQDVPAGLTANVATVNVTEVELTAVTKIEANKPYVLANAGSAAISATFVGIGEANAETNGALTGVYESTEAIEGTYVLQNQDGKYAFYIVESAKPTITAYHAYLTAPTAGVKAFGFDAIATAIDQIATEATAAKGIYNLQGQQLNGLQRGINIVNGKKVLVK